MALAAGNKATGAEVIQLLEDRFGKSKITNKVTETAACHGSHRTMKLLLDWVEESMITEEVLTKAKATITSDIPVKPQDL